MIRVLGFGERAKMPGKSHKTENETVKTEKRSANEQFQQ
jgi:hypothetical protein